MSRLATMVLRIGLALGLSIGLWAFVSFSENPDEQATFEGLSLVARGVSSGLVLVDQNSLPNPPLPGVDVTVVTDRRQRNQIRPVDLRAFVDLSDFGPGDYTVPVGIEVVRSDLTVTVPPNGVEPPTVPIRIEELISATVPITLVIQGNLPFSFEFGLPEIRQGGRLLESVSVQGPQSRVQRVVATRAVANVDQIRASYSAPLQLVPIDVSGQVVEGVVLEPGVANVTIPIRPVVGLRLVPVRANIIGLPAAGYGITNVEVDPQLVTLTGNSGALDLVEAIATEPIDISDAQSSLQREVALIFPDGTSSGPEQVRRVTVTVRVAALSQTFQVSLPAQITLSGIGRGLLASAQPLVVTITLGGSTARLSSLGAQPLLANIDLSGLGPGSYLLTPELDLPQGVTPASLPEVLVIIRGQPTPEPAPTTAATAVPTNGPTPNAPTPTPNAAPTEAPSEPPAAPSEPPSASPSPGQAPAPSETPGPGETVTPTP